MWFKKKLINSTKCYNQNSTGECNLIKKLKELQAQKREIDKQAEDYEKNRSASTDNFIKLLVEMEKAQCFMFCNSRILHNNESGVIKHFENHGTCHLEYALGSFSESRVQLICNELKNLSNKVNTIAEKREASNKLAAEIKEIKDVLGIE